MSGRPDGPKLTGRTVLAIAAGAFAVVLAANLTLLVSATGTFPGLVVKNSYVAGVGWDARAAAQRALGWRSTLAYDGIAIRARVTDAAGRPVDGLSLEAAVGRPATAAEDRTVTLTLEDGEYAAPMALGPGLWQVVLRSRGADAPAYEALARFHVPAGS